MSLFYIYLSYFFLVPGALPEDCGCGLLDWVFHCFFFSKGSFFCSPNLAIIVGITSQFINVVLFYNGPACLRFVRQPDEFIAFPNEFIAFPDEFIAFPDEFIAFPDEFIAFPDNFEAIEAVLVSLSINKEILQFFQLNPN